MARDPLSDSTLDGIISGRGLLKAFGLIKANFVGTGDERLSDARTPLSHTHTKSEITDFPTTFPPSSHRHNVSDLNGYQPDWLTSADSSIHLTDDGLEYDFDNIGSGMIATDKDLDNKQDKTSLESDVKTFINKEYIESLFPYAEEVEF